MIRTTTAAVEGIIEVDASIPLTPFIEIASALVDDTCLDSDYTSTKLELIERWLAAHFYTVRDPRASSEKVATLGVSYQSAVQVGLACSHYGAAAMRIDTAGNLAALDKAIQSGLKTKATVFWLGEEDE